MRNLQIIQTAVLALSIFPLSAATPPPVYYTAPQLYLGPTSGETVDFALGDFNGDGKPDMAIAAGSLAIMIGRPGGEFARGAQYQLAPGEATVSVAAADFDTDGKLDLAVTVGPAVTIMLGNGDGTFRKGASYTFSATVNWLAVGDFNGDGKPDVAAISLSAVSILMNNGDGTFAPPVPYSLPDSATFVVAADFNADGRSDLAVATTSGSPSKDGVSILLAKPDGTFQPPQISAFDIIGTIAVADLNGDGKLDIVSGAGGVPFPYSVAVLLGHGDGTFEAPVYYATTEQVGAVTVADLNADGRLDVAAANGFYVTVFSGNGDGTLGAATSYLTGNDGDTKYMQAADLNGDGKPDLLFADAVGPLVLLADNRTGFAEATDIPTLDDVRIVVTGDFNGDGKPDIAEAGLYQNAWVISILTNGKPGKTYYPLGQLEPTWMIAADFNGDGKLDLAMTIGPETGFVFILLGNGDGTFQPPIQYAVGDYASSLAAGDFNSDGKLDLAVASQAGLYIFIGNGDGTFQPPSIYTGVASGLIVVGDFNGDGRPDVAQASGLNITVLLGNGDGTFPQMEVTEARFGSGLVAADFNGDGKLDLAIGASVGFTHQPGGLAILYGNGDGTFQRQKAVPRSDIVGSLALADMNGDGRLDLIVSGGSPFGEIELFLSKGNGTFELAPFEVSAFPIFSLAVADFNGDGKPDIATGYYAGVILLNSRKP